MMAHGKLSKGEGGDASSNSHERHNEQHASHRQLFGFLVRRKKKKKKCFWDTNASKPKPCFQLASCHKMFCGVCLYRNCKICTGPRFPEVEHPLRANGSPLHRIIFIIAIIIAILIVIMLVLPAQGHLAGRWRMGSQEGKGPLPPSCFFISIIIFFISTITLLWLEGATLAIINKW